MHDTAVEADSSANHRKVCLLVFELDCSVVQLAVLARYLWLQNGSMLQVTSLTWDGFLEALRRVAVVKFSRSTEKVRTTRPPCSFPTAQQPIWSGIQSVMPFVQDAALRQLLCQWVLPLTQQGPRKTPMQGLVNPVSLVCHALPSHLHCKRMWVLR